MTLTAAHIDPPVEDPVSNVLKWVLLVVAIATFGLLAWATVETYRAAPPQPDRFVTADGTVLMTDDDIVAGKGGFQKADLMDYGSLYGMGSYYGEDYTASTLVRLGTETRNNVAVAANGRPFASLTTDQQAAATAVMQHALQSIDLTKTEVVLTPPVAAAIVSVRDDLAKSLNIANPTAGWTPAYSLNPQLARQTADFLVFSALTTVARRPGVTWSWTQNWPYEPLVGNTPTTNTFRWTWISFCFTFFAFGVVLFIYEFFLNNPDDAPMDPVLATFRPLTPSQRRIGKYFLVVAALLLVQIGAGIIMAHSYYDRASFYGIAINDFLPFNFLRDVHIQAPIVWIGLSWIGAALFLAPAIAGGQEAKGQHWLVDFLFWVTLLVVAGALIGDYLGIMGVIDQNWFWFGNQGLSYIQLGRFWQIGFFVGLALWSLLVMRALWPSAALWRQGGWPVLDRAHPAGAPDLGVHHQYRGPLRVRHDPAHRHREVLHDHRLLALVGGPSLGRAVVRVLRRHHERLSPDVGRLGLPQARRAGDLFRDHPDLPRRGHRHRPPSLLGRRSQHVGADGQHVLLHRGAAAGAADHRGDQPLPSDQGASGVQIPARLHLCHRRGVLEFRRRGRVRRRHAQRAAGELLRARHLPDAQPCAHRAVRRFRRTGDRADLFLPAIHRCRAACASARSSGFGPSGSTMAGWCYGYCSTSSRSAGPQLDAVYEHGLAYARSSAFYNTTLFWQWMRLPGDVLFAAGALLMAWDFIVKLRPLYPLAISRLFFPGLAAWSSNLRNDNQTR